jgi:uncharacterized protein YbaP (TraB family)
MPGPLRALALCLALMLPAEALALPPVWVVRDADSTIVLFGSVHLLPKGVAWKPPALDEAMSQADDVWFEAPMDATGQAELTAAAQANALLPQGQTLSALLSPKGRADLQKVSATLKIPVSDLEPLRPWFAELMVSRALFDRLGAEGEDGVEQTVWRAVPPAAERRTLETPAEQVAFFADAPLKDQVASLEETLRDASKAEVDYKALLQAWLAGDIRRLDKEVVEPLKTDAPGLYRRVVVERNARWTEEIARRMQGHGRTVIIVGMGHLIGPDGVPARLRARGFKVEGPR